MKATERLCFDQLDVGLDEQLCPLWSDADVIRYTNFALIESREACGRLIQHLVEAHHVDGLALGPYAIVRGGRAIGLVGCQLRNLRVGECELWYLLEKASWGQGLATEAVRAALDHAFGYDRVRLISAQAVPENVASWRILEKLGMRREGRLRQRFVRDGVSYDLFSYSILRQEWESGQRAARPVA
jgi:ribosomal-protein-alanine N-acetyltransferase